MPAFKFFVHIGVPCVQLRLLVTRVNNFGSDGYGNVVSLVDVDDVFISAPLDARTSACV